MSSQLVWHSRLNGALKIGGTVYKTRAWTPTAMCAVAAAIALEGTACPVSARYAAVQLPSLGNAVRSARGLLYDNHQRPNAGTEVRGRADTGSPSVRHNNEQHSRDRPGAPAVATRDQDLKLLRRPVRGDGPVTTFRARARPGLVLTHQVVLVPDRRECEGSRVLLTVPVSSSARSPAAVFNALAHRKQPA